MFNLFNKKKAAKMVEYKEDGKSNEIQECVTSASDFKISSKYLKFIRGLTYLAQYKHW